MFNPAISELPISPYGKTGWPWTESTPQLPETMPDGSSWPRVSIVTPSYNQGQFIEETIRSVLLQSYPNLEYIVMDGGSTDGSVQIIRKYEPWLSYLHIGPDDGQSAALSEGFRQATGEILAWLNSDDYFMLGALTRVAFFLSAHPKVIFGSGDVNRVDAGGNLIHRIYAVRPNRYLTANLGIHYWPQQGCFWRRWAYEQVGGVDPSLRFCMVRDLFIRITGTGPSRRIPGPPLAIFRVHEQAKSSTILDVAEEESAILIKKYGNSTSYSSKWFLRKLWWLWCRPLKLRVRLNRRFGWEW